MAVYPTVKYELYVNSAWLDITPDVVGASEKCSYGIMGNTLLDRVASPGQMSLTLRNDTGNIGGVEGYYSQNRVGSLPGFGTGLPVRQTITYLAFSFVKRWYITTISVGTIYNRIVQITCADWIEYASRNPLILPVIEENKDISGVAAAVVALMPRPPLATSYGVGTDIFPTIFDTVREQSVALSEFAKVAQSELGYIYLRREETLVVEGRQKRTGYSEQVVLPVLVPYNILMEAGESLLMESGNHLLLDMAVAAALDDLMVEADVSIGENVTNYIEVKSYPRYVDAAATTVLWQLNTAISIPAGETQTMRANYRDPAGGASQVAGKDMVTPVARTHYYFDSDPDGGGTDLTDDLEVTVTYGANDVYYELTNAGVADGFVIMLKAVGKGIYIYDPVTYTTQDDTSINAYGYRPMTFNMKYQSNPGNTSFLADVVLGLQKDPRTTLSRVAFNANVSSYLMRMFIIVDIGDMVEITETLSGASSSYYIQGINYEVFKGGIIKVEYTVLEAAALDVDYWLLGTAGRGELDTATYLGY